MADGFNALIENNVIDGVYGAGIVLKNVYSSAPSGSGYVFTLRNNIITNSRSSSGGSGYGVSNELTDTHSFVLQNNCFYGNDDGNYKNVQASSSDLKADPLYADRNNHDYHLKSKAGRWNGKSWVTDNTSSLCIDAEYSLSDYSSEPQNNGGRINIGAFGNTKYASKSGAPSNKAPLIKSIQKATVEIGKILTFSVSASNEDENTLTYSASNLTAGAILDSNSGFLAGLRLPDRKELTLYHLR